MNIIAIATLMVSSGGAEMNAWPDEVPALDRPAILAAMKSDGSRKYFESAESNARYQSVLTVELHESMPWDAVVDQAWSCLPPPEAHSAIRGSKGLIDNAVLVRTADGFQCWRGFGSRPSSAHVILTAKPSIQEATVALANMGVGAVGANVRRVSIPTAGIGDEAQKVVGGNKPSIEFRLGRIVVMVQVGGQENERGEQAALDMARAVEFRIWASGLMGDRNREFVLSNGVKLKGVTTTHGYVPLSEIARLGAAVESVDDPIRRRATMRRGATTVRADEYLRELRVNGQPIVAPPAIPYKGDLWVPVRAVVEALGYTITG